RAIAEATPADARLLADESLLPGFQLPYVSRRVLFGGNRIPNVKPDLLEWQRIGSGRWNPRLEAFIAAHDGVVLGPKTRHLRPHLQAMGWQNRVTGERYELWVPATLPRSVDHRPPMSGSTSRP